MDVIIKIYLGLTFFTLSVIDFKTMRLPNQFTYPLIMTGVIHGCSLGEWRTTGLGLALGVIPFAIIRYLGNHFFKQESLGLGDIKLMAGIGAWFGPIIVGWTLYVGILVAAIPALFIKLFVVDSEKTHLPLGPFLIAGCLIKLSWEALK